MKKIALAFLAFFITLQSSAQEFDTIRLPEGETKITQELAKELLLYSYISMTDSIIIGESMNFLDCHHCNGFDYYPYKDVDILRFRDQMDDWSVLSGLRNNGFLYYIETPGECVDLDLAKKLKLSSASNYINGYAIVRDENREYPPDYGYLDDAGMFMRETDGRRYALINKQGKVCIPFGKYDKIKGGVYDNLIPVCKQGKWGFADLNGNIKIKIQYSDVRHFSEGLAAVKKDGKWGYIDTKGVEKIPFKYVDAYPFKNGVAVVRREGTVDEYCDASTIPGGLAVGLVDHEGHSTYDFYGREASNGMSIQEYAGVYVDDITGSQGYAKYTYYERSGGRVKHGYYVFVNDTYIIEGHYKDGEKHGRWLKIKRDQNVLDWSTQLDFIKRYNPIIKKKDPSLPGYYEGNQLFIVGKDTINPYYIDLPFRHWEFNNNHINYKYGIPSGDFVFEGIYSHCSNGRVDANVEVEGIGGCAGPFDSDLSIPVDKEGNVSGNIILGSIPFNEEYSNIIPIEITLTFYKGVPMRIISYNESTGEKRKVFEYEGFSSIEEIEEIVSGGKTLYRIGDYYYKIEPKDPRYPFDIIDIDKYPDCISKPLSFLLNLPASWPVPNVKSPQLNFFRRASWADLKGVYYTQYRKYFTSEKEFDDAYSIGEGAFMQIVYEKQDELKRNAFQQYQHLFCDNKDFNTYYSKGEELFAKEIAIRDSLHSHYLLSKDWFVNFCDYHETQSSGVQPEEELRVRQKEFEKVKVYFINPQDFVKYYFKGHDSISVEIEQRSNMFENSIDPFSKSPLFKDFNEFLEYYCKGNASLAITNRIQANKAHVNGQFGNLFIDMSVFDSLYEQGEDLFMQEAAFRKFRTKIEEFSEINLKGATTSKKDAIKQYLDFVNECTEISQKAYPRIVKLMVTSNEKMSKEWSSNGKYFKSEIEFYEAYISENYKEILKSKKK